MFDTVNAPCERMCNKFALKIMGIAVGTRFKSMRMLESLTRY